MNIIILGAGKMGLRHAEGVVKIDEVNKVILVDNNPNAIENAKQYFTSNNNLMKLMFYDNINQVNKDIKYDIGIISTTANNRIELLHKLVNLNCTNILVEKPLGQSYKQIVDFSNEVDDLKINCFVNLNMRINESFSKLYDDLKSLPQFVGEKTITINTGTIGIGANGIHYLDFLFYLLEADNAKIINAEIQNELITSGRGENFSDFGGWAIIKFFRENKYQGKALLSFNSNSSVFGAWEIVGTHGRINFNEVEQKRIDVLRNENSKSPIYRYHADYLDPVITNFPSPFLGDLTQKWVKTLFNKNISILPTIKQSLNAHKLMFEWLEFSPNFKEQFPIT